MEPPPAAAPGADIPPMRRQAHDRPNERLESGTRRTLGPARSGRGWGIRWRTANGPGSRTGRYRRKSLVIFWGRSPARRDRPGARTTQEICMRVKQILSISRRRIMSEPGALRRTRFRWASSRLARASWRIDSRASGVRFSRNMRARAAFS